MNLKESIKKLGNQYQNYILKKESANENEKYELRVEMRKLENEVFKNLNPKIFNDELLNYVKNDLIEREKMLNKLLKIYGGFDGNYTLC